MQARRSWRPIRQCSCTQSRWEVLHRIRRRRGAPGPCTASGEGLLGGLSTAEQHEREHEIYSAFGDPPTQQLTGSSQHDSASRRNARATCASWRAAVVPRWFFGCPDENHCRPSVAKMPPVAIRYVHVVAVRCRVHRGVRDVPGIDPQVCAQGSVGSWHTPCTARLPCRKVPLTASRVRAACSRRGIVQDSTWPRNGAA